jgi:quercetin dioxygenase-like cupin family protein
VTGSDDTFWFLNTLTIIRASGEVTDRRLSLVEQTAPSGHAPPPHKHQREDEWFYVLDGELTFWLDGDRSVGGPGSLAFLPKGIPHGFAVTSPDPARFLIGTSPSGFDSFVRAVGTRVESANLPPANHPVPSPDELGQIAAAHGIELLGPPGLPD